MLAVLSNIRIQQLHQSGSPTLSEMVRHNDCRAELYRTYRGIVEYARENGTPPRSLEELVGKYTSRLPTNPATGAPLAYSTDGKGFRLRCGANPR
jgi:hypothetical protein